MARSLGSVDNVQVLEWELELTSKIVDTSLEFTFRQRLVLVEHGHDHRGDNCLTNNKRSM